MAASERAPAAGLQLLFLSRVLPSLQDSFPRSLSCLGQRCLAEVLGYPTPSATSVLEDPYRISQVMLVVVNPGGVFSVASTAGTIPCCRDVLVCKDGMMVCSLSIRPTSSAGQARFL